MSERSTVTFGEYTVEQYSKRYGLPIQEQDGRLNFEHMSDEQKEAYERNTKTATFTRFPEREEPSRDIRVFTELEIRDRLAELELERGI